MRRLLSLAVILVCVLALFSGCDANRAADETASGKTVVVATLFPQYDFARQIGGDRVDVRLILPPGTESHSYEPAPNDIRAINDADLFLYTGADMEPWAQSIVESLDGSVKVVDVSQGIVPIANGTHDEAHAHDDDDDHAHDESEMDPHIWLDPTRAIEMVANIETALCAIDAPNAAYYREHAAQYTEDLEALDQSIEQAVQAGKRDTIAFGGRFAYQYFLARYGLHAVSAYDGCAMEAEPSIRRIAEVVQFISTDGIPVVYHEEFVDPVVARSIAEQTGAKLLLFSTCHNVTKDELESGVTYIDLMRRNLENLKEGLQ